MSSYKIQVRANAPISPFRCSWPRCLWDSSSVKVFIKIMSYMKRYIRRYRKNVDFCSTKFEVCCINPKFRGFKPGDKLAHSLAAS